MSDEEVKEEVAAAEPASEVSNEQEPVQETEQAQDATVPRSAYIAERKKRQEMEEQNRQYQEYMLKMQSANQEEQRPPPDPDEWPTRREMYEREGMVMEEMWKQSNPDKYLELELYLEKIGKQKPWVTSAIASAQNKYATAYEIVQDYKHLVGGGKNEKVDEAKRALNNAQKPGSPSTIAKGANASSKDYLLGLRGKPEFKKYRQDMLKGR